MTPIRVLVTGAGSGVGQGIIKGLRIAALPVTIVVGDIVATMAGLYRADEAVLIPRVEDAGALEIFIDLLKRHEIHVVMVGSEFDLTFMARHKAQIEAATGALIVASPIETVATADDKWRTYEFLEAHGLARPRSMLPADMDDAKRQAREIGYPLILKSRVGTSARNVHVIHDEASLIALFPSVPRPMLQEFIGTVGNDLAEEFTCAVFQCKDGQLLGPITARRTLRGGSSWVVEVDRFDSLHPMLLNIARALPSMGSLNVQLRIGPRGPLPFEFNSRFSGTTAVRAHFGFNEPELVLRSYLLGETLDQPAIGRGIAFRYLEEVFVDGFVASELSPEFHKGIVRPWF